MNKTDAFRKSFYEGGNADCGAAITSEENRRYLTDFPASDGVIAIAGADAVFLTDSRYIEAARESVGSMRVEELRDAYAQLKAFFGAHGVTTVAVESETMTVAQFDRFRKAMDGFAVTADGRVDRCIRAQRCVKDESEVARIVRAQRIAEAALAHILGFIAPGKTEKEVALELDYYMLSHGAEALSFDTIAVSGPNTSRPHGVPSERKIERGDFVTMDFGAVYQGLHSDMTRTVAVGAASDRQRLVYQTVLDAKNAAEREIRAGLPAAQADKTARDVIERAGFGEAFRHSTGHGVGYEIHELPYVSPKSDYILRAGNVVTVEPGIYLPGEFGARIEDMVLVREDGAQTLTAADDRLIVL